MIRTAQGQMRKSESHGDHKLEFGKGKALLRRACTYSSSDSLSLMLWLSTCGDSSSKERSSSGNGTFWWTNVSLTWMSDLLAVDPKSGSNDP